VYGAVTDAVTSLGTRGFLRPTRAASWTVQDLLFHLLLDAQRALIAFASPTEAPVDVDAVTYWLPFKPDTGDIAAPHARFVRIASSAYADPEQLTQHWRSTSAAAVRAATAALPGNRVETQGHVLEVTDFVDTLVVEATIHYLDLTLHIDGPPLSVPALALTRGVLDGLLGEPVTAQWSDIEYLLKGTGRVPLTNADRATLGGHASRLPLLG
jgi:hypothetical protein